MVRGNEIDDSRPNADVQQSPDFSDYIAKPPVVLAQVDNSEGDMQARRDIERMVTGLTDQLKATNDLSAAQRIAENFLGPDLDSNRFNKLLERADQGWPNDGGYIKMRDLLSQALRGSGYSAQFEGTGNHQPLTIKKGSEYVWPRIESPRVS